jgi:hypothetical protein
LLQTLKKSFFPDFAVVHVFAALGSHNDGIINAENEGSASMPPTRWLARLTIPMIAGAALVASAAIATADPRDDGYLDQLRGAGLTWPPGHEDALIGTAYLICDDLGWGWTPQHIANSVHATLDPDGISVHDVGAMVNIARAVYCPNQRCWAPHC